MPVFFYHEINATTKLAIWHITESESFFLSSVPLQASITHPHKRLQHLAGRYLLQHLFTDFPYEELQIADTRKPFLPNEQYHFSISHCGVFAAAIASSTHRVGIDIEIPVEKVKRISHKFIHQKEADLIASGYYHSYPETILWSAKEAVFKWYGLGEVNFKEHIRMLSPFSYHTNTNLLQAAFVFQKHFPVELDIQAKIFEQLCCCWLFSAIELQ